MGIGYSTELENKELPYSPTTNHNLSDVSDVKRSYGWKRDMPDHRDMNHVFSSTVMNTLSSKEDLRKYMPPIYNQGELGSCTANAIAGAFQFDEIKQYREKILKMREESDKKITSKCLLEWSNVTNNKEERVTRSVSKKKKKGRKQSKIVEKVMEQLDEEPLMIFKQHEVRDPIIFIPSRLFIYYNERSIEGSIDTDSGAAIRDGMKSINKTGVCKEDDWKYDITKFTEKPPESCYKEAQGFKSKKYIKGSSDLKHLKAYIKSGFPVIFGFVVFESFEGEDVAKTGIMPMPKDDEKRLGGHAVLMCGYDDEQNRFIIRNSWGKEWGDNGYFYMPYEFVETPGYCDDFWVMYTITDTNEKLLNCGKDTKKQTHIDDFLNNVNKKVK
tara:strand:+ start:6611 stop:7765 length:1155 start_codon:yes stop_codon:yes gene_type:complete